MATEGIISVNDDQYDERICTTCSDLLKCKDRKYKYCDKNLVRTEVEFPTEEGHDDSEYIDPKLVEISKIVNDWTSDNRSATLSMIAIKQILDREY